MAWAGTVPFVMGNVMYPWTHMELKNPFGITDRLFGPDTAGEIWRQVKEFHPQALKHWSEGMSHEQKEATKAQFMTDPACRVLISTRQSLAVGANLVKATQGIFNDLPWNGADIQQAQDRYHRINQTRPVTVHWVVAANSDFDVALIGMIERKFRLQKAVTEGKKLTPEEVEYLKKPESQCFSDLIGSGSKKKKKKVEAEAEISYSDLL
jgi:hypothetical protein